MNIQELINKKNAKNIIKTLIPTLISIILIIVLIPKVNIKDKENQNIKININKKERSNYPLTETVWATLEIPTLKIKANVYRGGKEEFLNYGLVHHKESYFPTDGGTIVIAGNNTYLKNLSKLKANDKITLKTLYGTYTYKVEKTRVKSADVLNNELEIKNNEEKLILYAPYPETEGYKSDRLVVYAK
jgi:LPXTG-site transpeptidase (sortase) family protein